ncbi:MAG: hypothetical protein K8T20_09100 [Planctomycetes bacterium]|nr:hypothetical protein [Planctomycetota bacterium]
MKTAATMGLLLLLALAPGLARGQAMQGGDPDEADARPFPKLALGVKVTEERDKPTGDMVRVIIGSGDTEYPPGTALIMDARLEGGSSYLDKKHQVFVDENGHWEAAIDDLGRNIYKGQYEVRVTFDPTFQPRGVMNRIDAKKNSQLQSRTTEVRIGTAEEEAAEKIDVDQFFARSFAKARELCELTFKEYAKQSEKPDKRKWGDFYNDTNDAFVNADHDLAQFLRLRDNLRDFRTYEMIAQIYAICGSRLFPVLSAALGIEGGTRTPAEKAEADRMMSELKVTLAALENTVGKTVIDPKWVMLKPLVPIKLTQPPPPVGPIDEVPTLPIQNGPARTGDKIAPKSKFGVTELGIGLAIMCGLAMLVVLLKRK